MCPILGVHHSFPNVVCRIIALLALSLSQWDGWLNCIYQMLCCAVSLLAVIISVVQIGRQSVSLVVFGLLACNTDPIHPHTAVITPEAVVSQTCAVVLGYAFDVVSSQTNRII